MGTAESFFSVGNGVIDFFWSRRKKLFVLNKGHSSIQQKKIKHHQHKLSVAVIVIVIFYTPIKTFAGNINFRKSF